MDFSQATATRLDLYELTQLTVSNFNSTGATYSALNVINSTQILIVQPHIVLPGTAGITIQGSDTVEVSGSWVEQSSGDGIDIAGSSNVNVHDGACQANVVTSLHPDCVQLWSVTGYPVQHIIVQNMTAVGNTMGFDLWGGTNLGANDIQFLNNTAAITQANCVGAINAQQLVVSGNDCHTLPGANGPPTLNIKGSPGAVITNNVLGLPLARGVLQ
jgi:hypothetical protein